MFCTEGYDVCIIVKPGECVLVITGVVDLYLNVVYNLRQMVTAPGNKPLKVC
jgi:hypothetical protein